MTRGQRTIGAPLAYINGRFEHNCTINIDAITKKIVNIAVNVDDMDSLHSVEYYSGIITPLWDGWSGTMTARKIKELLDRYRELNGTFLSGILESACRSRNIKAGYNGPLMLLSGIDFKNLELKENSNLKIL